MSAMAMPDWMYAVLPLLGGVAGAMPTTSSAAGNQTSSQNVNTTSSTNTQNFIDTLIKTLNQINTQQTGTTATTATTTPNLPAGTQNLIDQLTRRYQTLATPSLAGYEAQQIQGINRNAALQNQAVANLMASRGLSTSPAAGTAAANVEAQRFGNITNMQAGLPLLKNQLDLSNLGAATQFLGAVPFGTTTTTGGTSTLAGTQTQTGQQQQQQTGGTAAFTQGNQQQFGQSTSNQQQKAGGGIGASAGAIAAILASLFSDKRLKKEIKEISKEEALDKLMTLRPVNWKWKASEVDDTGLIAQDLQKVMPELVHKDPDGSQFLKVNYAGLIGEIISAVQSINAKVEANT